MTEHIKCQIEAKGYSVAHALQAGLRRRVVRTEHVSLELVAAGDSPVTHCNRRIIVPRYGGPDVMTVIEEPLPEPGSGEVRVRILVAGVG